MSPAEASPGIGPAGDVEARAEFLLRLRAKGVRDLALLRVLETLPRELFAPHRYTDLAAREVALPIACGQTMSEPFLVAKMVEALALRPKSRVLEIGAGSGYVTAVLARLADQVLAFERYRALALQAQARLRDLGIDNAAVIWGDGLAIPPETGQFDRLIIHASLDAIPETLTARLAKEAITVYATPATRTADVRQQIVRAICGADGDWTTEDVCPSRLRPLEPGLSYGL